MFKLWTVLGLTATTLANAVPMIKSSELIQKRLNAIDTLIEKKDFVHAIEKAVTTFNLNASQCRAITPRIIERRDENGNVVLAYTQLDQMIAIDPRQNAFKNARYLVSILTHEITHCDQNQHMYTLSLINDREFAPLKDKLVSLRAFADLTEIAGVAVKEGPAKADAINKFKILSSRYGIESNPERIAALSHKFIENVQNYNRSVGELHEMEASLRAIEMSGVIPPPTSTEPKASEEFALQYRFLMLSTNKFLRLRQLFVQDPNPKRFVSWQILYRLK